MTLALAVASGVALYVCYLVARPFIPSLAWALTLAIVAHPLHVRVSGRVRRPGLAAGVSVAIVAVTIIAPAALVTREVVREALAGGQAAREELETGTWRERFAAEPRLARALDVVEQNVDLRAEAERVSGQLGPMLSSLLTGTVAVLVQLAVTLFSLFFFLRDRQAALRAARRLLPLTDAETDCLFGRVRDTVRATVFGNVATSFVQGGLGGLMFWWLGLPAPLLWGAAMFVLSLVPTLGSFVVWAPAAALLALQGSWGKALILAVWGATAIGLIDNVLYPVLVGGELRLHTLPLFISLVGGVALFGASGLVLGPLALAVTLALLEIWRVRTRGGHAADALDD